MSIKFNRYDKLLERTQKSVAAEQIEGLKDKTLQHIRSVIPRMHE